jgi:hypothetical protein
MQGGKRSTLVILAWIGVGLVVVQLVSTFLRVRSEQKSMPGGIKTISLTDSLQVKMQKLAEEAVVIAFISLNRSITSSFKRSI